MRAKLFFPLALLLTLLLSALSTGSALLLMLAVLVFLTLLFGLLSVWMASATLTVSMSLDRQRVTRGETVSLLLQVRHRGFLPIAPVALDLTPLPGEGERTVFLRDQPGKLQSLTLPCAAIHVGVWKPGIRACAVEDLLGFFHISRRTEREQAELLVLPSSLDTEPLTLSPGDPGSDIISRATEDLSSPSDFRAYETGDPMKKIHWKLSARKGELLVRKFDEPILRDVLMLMDCSRPPSLGHPGAEADLRDALLETAASVMENRAGQDLSIHLPLPGAHPIELESGMGLPLILENLARLDFSETDRFERFLVLESRRLRKVGCLVVISARLNSAIVDVMIRLRRLGPTLRFYLVSFTPDDARLLPLISRLQQADIRVAYVQPELHGPQT